MKMKINPIDWVKIALSKKNEYDKYLEKGDFSEEAFFKLMEKRKQKFMDSTIDYIKKMPFRIEKKDYIIELQRNTGIYRLFIPTNLDTTSWCWITNYISELFDVNIQTDKDKNTFFIKDYFGINNFHLSHLFDDVTEKDEIEWKENNIVITPNVIEKDAEYLITKINIFLKIIDKIYFRVKEEAFLKEK
jgi:hypothetical protein